MKLISTVLIVALSNFVPTTLGFTQQAARRFALTTRTQTQSKANSAINSSYSPFAAFQNRRKLGSSSTSVNMIRTRGLEKVEEGATPLVGGMTLFIKPAADGTSPGDCPFAHYVRMVLHEKSLPYELRPCTQATKPDWLIDHYEGKMPALRHRKECYVESDVIAQYLDFFFPEPKLSPYTKKEMADAGECTDGFFPAVARYLKSTENGSEDDLALKENLEGALGKIESQLGRDGKTGSFLAGDGEQVTLLDCSLAPKLYHMSIGLKSFKDGAIDIETSFPKVKAYMDAIFDTDSFKEASYPEETVVWGWTNARS